MGVIQILRGREKKLSFALFFLFTAGSLAGFDEDSEDRVDYSVYKLLISLI